MGLPIVRVPILRFLLLGFRLESYFDGLPFGVHILGVPFLGDPFGVLLWGSPVLRVSTGGPHLEISPFGVPFGDPLWWGSIWGSYFGSALI